jgi:uncharacterized protein YkwD
MDKFKRQAMKKLVYILGVFLLSCSPPETIKEIVVTYNYSFSEKEFEIASNLNAYRQSKGLTTLQLEQTASYICQEHNNYMISINELTHFGFQSRSQKLGAIQVAENLSRGYDNPIYAWENSLEHKQNMEGNFTHFGVAEKDGYVTVLLIRR